MIVKCKCGQEIAIPVETTPYQPPPTVEIEPAKISVEMVFFAVAGFMSGLISSASFLAICLPIGLPVAWVTGLTGFFFSSIALVNEKTRNPAVMIIAMFGLVLSMPGLLTLAMMALAYFKLR